MGSSRGAVSDAVVMWGFVVVAVLVIATFRRPAGAAEGPGPFDGFAIDARLNELGPYDLTHGAFRGGPSFDDLPGLVVSDGVVRAGPQGLRITGLEIGYLVSTREDVSLRLVLGARRPVDGTDPHEALGPHEFLEPFEEIREFDATLRLPGAVAGVGGDAATTQACVVTLDLQADERDFVLPPGRFLRHVEMRVGAGPLLDPRDVAARVWLRLRGTPVGVGSGEVANASETPVAGSSGTASPSLRADSR